jgi:hypothetical protein
MLGRDRPRHGPSRVRPGAQLLLIYAYLLKGAHLLRRFINISIAVQHLNRGGSSKDPEAMCLAPTLSPIQIRETICFNTEIPQTLHDKKQWFC